MAQILKVLHSKPIFQISRLATAGQIKQCHWYPDYTPGPYPKTEEEKKACAKKYNLLPEEYEPYPDDGSGCGDYPKLPLVSVDAKDPYYDFDNPQLRRDYMEPVHIRIMNLMPTSLSTHAPLKVSHPAGSVRFLAVFTAAVLVVLWGERFIVDVPMVKKQLPASGQKHYTFEIDYDLKIFIRQVFRRWFN